MDYQATELVARYVEGGWGDFFSPTGAGEGGARALYAFGARTRSFYIETARILEEVVNPRPRTICDIGTASGRMSFELARIFPGAAIVASEPAPRLAALTKAILTGKEQPPFLPVMSDARKAVEYRPFPASLANAHKAMGAFTFVEAPGEQTPYPAGHFDLVLALNILDRVPKPKDFIKQISPLVAPSGRLVLMTPYDWEDYTTQPDDRIDLLSDFAIPGFAHVHSAAVEYVFRKDCFRLAPYMSDMAIFARR